MIKPKNGEFYYYIDNDGRVVKRMNTLQDIDILNGMYGNYYKTEEKAMRDLHIHLRKDVQK